MKKIISILSSTLLLTWFSCGMAKIEGHDDMEFIEKRGNPFSNGFYVYNSYGTNVVRINMNVHSSAFQWDTPKQVDFSYFSNSSIVETKIIDDEIIIIKENMEIAIDNIPDGDHAFSGLYISKDKNIASWANKFIIYGNNGNNGNNVIEQEKENIIILMNDKILFELNKTIYYMDINTYEITEVVSFDGEWFIERLIMMNENYNTFSIIESGNIHRKIYDIEGNLKVEWDQANDTIPWYIKQFCYVNDELYVLEAVHEGTYQTSWQTMTKWTGPEESPRYKTTKFPVGCTSEGLTYLDSLNIESLEDITYYEYAL